MKWWDIKTTPVKPDPSETADRHHMRKLLETIPHGGIMGSRAYLIVYNRAMPERSYVIVEDINI